MISHQRLAVFLFPSLLALAIAGCGGGGSGSKGTSTSGVAGAQDSGPDKVTCSVNTDCDTDEVCTNGLCTGLPDPCKTNSDCASDEVCSNGNCV